MVIRRRISTDVYLTPEFFLLPVLIDLKLSLFRVICDFYCSFRVERVERFRNDIVCVEDTVEGTIQFLYAKIQ